jgi:hypothetical protein
LTRSGELIGITDDELAKQAGEACDVYFDNLLKRKAEDERVQAAWARRARAWVPGDVLCPDDGDYDERKHQYTVISIKGDWVMIESSTGQRLRRRITQESRRDPDLPPCVIVPGASVGDGQVYLHLKGWREIE